MFTHNVKNIKSAVDFDGQKHIFRIVIKRGEKEGNLVVTPDIVCENFMEAQHLASTLALYKLCKGQVRTCDRFSLLLLILLILVVGQ